MTVCGTGSRRECMLKFKTLKNDVKGLRVDGPARKYT